MRGRASADVPGPSSLCYPNREGGDRTISRLISKPIAVTLGRLPGEPKPVPVEFVYLKERHRVTAILDTWLQPHSLWWEDPQAMKRGPAEERVYRVQTVKGGVFELARYENTWVLQKAYD